MEKRLRGCQNKLYLCVFMTKWGKSDLLKTITFMIAWICEYGLRKSDCVSFMLYLHLCLLWLGALLRQAHWDCNARWGHVKRTCRFRQFQI